MSELLSPEDMLQRPLPDLALPGSIEGRFRLRSHVGRGPQVLFFFVHHGTPGWVRELREFRVLHDQFQSSGISVAGISLDTVEAHRRWAERLRIPYPLLSDEERAAGRAFGILRRVGIGGWNLEFLRRSTFLADEAGLIAAVWSKVKLRGHAAEVLEVARVLASGAADRARERGRG